MRIEYFGLSAFRLEAHGKCAFTDPYPRIDKRPDSDWEINYPPVPEQDADLLLVTHEHLDHNAVDRIGESPQIIRASAGTDKTVIGEVVGIASDLDDVAGTRMGHNTIHRFEFDGLRVAHFGDYGQPELRPGQRTALGTLACFCCP